MKIFFDSSVVIAALLSHKGASALLFALCEAESLEGIISSDVVEEVSKVLKRKLPEAEPHFKIFIEKSKLKIKPIVNRTESVANAEKFISDPADAHIIAAALQCKADYLVTLDLKHFIRDKSVAKKTKLRIMTPGEFVKRTLHPGA